MTIFYDMSSNDTADVSGTLSGFTGGTLAQLQDGFADEINCLNGGDDEVVAGDRGDTIRDLAGNIVRINGRGGDDLIHISFTFSHGIISGGPGGGGGDADKLKVDSSTDISVLTLLDLEILHPVGTVFGRASQFKQFDTISFESNPTTPVSLNFVAIGIDVLADLRDELAGRGAFITGSSDSETIVGGLDGQNIIDGNGGNDNVTGGNRNDTLNGNDGNDILIGLGGNDVLNGGAGIDTADYSTASAGVSLNLGYAAAQNTGGSGSDAPISIENVIGSAFNDSLAGTDVANVLTGRNGNDTLVGRGGNDTLDGGPGTDTVHYAGSRAGVTVNLATGVATGGWGTDTIIDAENVIASAFNDVLTGNSDANLLAGLGGNDVLDGGEGNDNLSGAHGADILHGGLGKDGLLGGNDADRFDFNSISETLPATRDVIMDFSRAQGDKIDLSTIDARLDLAGDQAFSFIGGAAFTGIDGQLRQTSNVIQGDVNGDQVADFEIVWNFAGSNLIGSDFIL